MKELIKGRYELLNPQDCSEFGNYYPGYPKSWGIYYKKIYCYFWESRCGYGLTVWIGSKADYSTGHSKSITLDSLINVLDRYLPKRKTEQICLF